MFFISMTTSRKNWKVEEILQKVGSSNLLNDTLSHLLDICLFNLAGMTYSPLEVVLVRAQKLDVPEYQEVVKHFNCVKKLDRNTLI